ncbi:MAG: aminopeptidase [Myxococcota bacterium]
MIHGQTQLLSARRPVAEVVSAPETAPELRAQLETVERVRKHAHMLGLSVDRQYTDYVAWPGDRIITTLVVAAPGSVEARLFRFPVVGRLPYKGFFDVARAERAAEAFREDGLDVCLVPVPAYSTLGIFSDPITQPMLRAGTGRTVETVLHELVHATVFVKGDTGLNESAASFIGQEASVDFYRSDPKLFQERRLEVNDDRMISVEILAFGETVRTLYDRSPEGHAQASPERRKAAEEVARARIRALPLTRRDPARVADLARLNDACLALRSTYSADLPLHQRIFDELGGDLPAFIERLRSASETEDPRTFFFALPETDPSS